MEPLAPCAGGFVRLGPQVSGGRSVPYRHSSMRMVGFIGLAVPRAPMA